MDDAVGKERMEEQSRGRGTRGETEARWHRNERSKVEKIYSGSIEEESVEQGGVRER